MSGLTTMFTSDKTSDVFKNLDLFKNPIKGLYKYYTNSSINLAGGIPLESCFPVEELDVKLTHDHGMGDEFSIRSGAGLHLNYHLGEGIIPLRDWTRDHVKQIHEPFHQIDVAMTIGATDAWAKTLTLLGGDYVLFDQYVYGASITSCKAQKKEPIGVKCDDEGIIPDEIRNTVRKIRAAGKTVTILYLIPTSHNPLGKTLSLERKKEIYEVCQEMDLLIVEDDAYYYLYYPAEEVPGIHGLPKSMMSFDVDGRVIRMDSMAKFIAPGMRLGWIVATPDFIRKYVQFQDITSQFPSGVSQSLFYGMINHWGMDGLHKHLQELQRHYQKQRDVLVESLNTFFPKGSCKFVVPTGGMFMWLEFPKLGVSSFELFEALAAVDVICAPGNSFYCAGFDELKAAEEGEVKSDVVTEREIAAVRVCYAAAKSDDIRCAIEKMAECVLKLPTV